MAFKPREKKKTLFLILFLTEFWNVNHNKGSIESQWNNQTPSGYGAQKVQDLEMIPGFKVEIVGETDMKPK